MGRRIEAGPLVVALGAVLLLVSLFLDWYSPGANAWESFEALDLVLAALALAGLAAAAGLIAPELAWLDRRWLAPLAIAAVIVVGSQVIDPPPAVGDADPDSGAWLALGAALLMAAGALLSFSRVKLALTVEGRDPRQRVAAVDARQGGSGPASEPGGEEEPTERLPPGSGAAGSVRPAPPAAVPGPPPEGGGLRGPAGPSGYGAPAARSGSPGLQAGAPRGGAGPGPHAGGQRGGPSGPPYGR